MISAVWDFYLAQNQVELMTGADLAPNDKASSTERADFFAILNPRKWCFPGI